MHLVDDEDLVAVAGRTRREVVDDDALRRFESRVGGRVDLDDVHVAAFRDLDARVALPHGSTVGPLMQFSAFARMRAVVVFPTPRAPAKI